MQNLKDVKFGRNYRAEFEIGKRDNEEMIVEEKLIISYPFTLNLHIDSGFSNASNLGIFQFINLSRQDQAALWIDEYNSGKKYVKMSLYAGYGDIMPLVFEGFFLKCTSYRESGSVNWVTQISAYDGGMLFQYGYVNMCSAKGTKLIDLVNYMTKEYGVKPGYITPDIPPLPRNRTFIGQTMDLLNREYGGYDIFIEKGELNILGANDVVPGDIQVISAETGLLGSPQRGNLYTLIDLIFEPRLRLRQAVSLYSNNLPEFNNLYEVVKIVHNGIISPSLGGKLITSCTLSLFPTDEQRELKKEGPTTYKGQPTTGIWQKPCAGVVTSPYGYRFHPIEKVWKGHKGMDIGAPLNTPIYAPANGIITTSQYEGANGNCIRINHGEINGKQVTSTLIHMNKLLVTPQTQVYKGQQIGLVGSTGKYPNGKSSSTGPHLHISTYENGKPVNPAKYIGNY